ncbi:MAG: ABC transporter permease [Actinobacteria bacterium]|nr:ABC transporter permease [Actinomycetota bacterium]
MFRLTWKNLMASKIRFALTTFGVVLAVSFVVSAFVLGDGLRRSFTDVSKDITAGIDFEVRNTADFVKPPPLPPDVVDIVAGVPAVRHAVASIEAADNAVRPITATGDEIPTSGPPQLAFNWIDDPALSAFTIVDGAPPQAGEFTIDLDSAEKYDFVIGHTYDVMVPSGRVQLTLSGTSSFGPQNATLGAVLMQMNTAQASELFGVDGIDSVAVALHDGSDPAEAQAAIAAAVTASVPTAEVVDRETVAADFASQFTTQIDLVGAILLAFGVVALVVSVFLIHNTFAIVVGQRSRELALLRTVGADPRQIRRSVLGEALAVGIIASATGIVGGIGVAKGIDALFGVMGFDLVDWPLILAPRTIVAAVVLGIGVTLTAAIGPARRAATVSPMVLLSGTTSSSGRHVSRRRALTGAAFIATGAALAAGGAAVNGAFPVGVGAILLFAGVTMLSPMAVGPVTRVLGWPLGRVATVTGRMAQRNAARNPRRSASTSAALMIGLAVVAIAMIAAESVKASIGSTLADSAKAEYYLSDELDEVAFPAEVVGETLGLAGVDAATGFTPLEVRIDDTVTEVIGFDFDQIDALLDVDVRAGAFDSDVSSPVVVSAGEAARRGLVVGDTVTITSPAGITMATTVAGTFGDQSVLTEDYLVDTRVLQALGAPVAPEWLAISVADDARPVDVQHLLDTLESRFPYAALETAAQFEERVAGEIDDALTMVNMMVALAVAIALIGIANTLALSVFERTHELGLVRAVGMSRRQVRRMVRYEAGLLGSFGATVGVGLGIGIGIAAVHTFPSDVATQVAVPWDRLGLLIVIATTAAVVSAWFAARRAGRLDVLDAIAH